MAHIDVIFADISKVWRSVLVPAAGIGEVLFVQRPLQYLGIFEVKHRVGGVGGNQLLDFFRHGVIVVNHVSVFHCRGRGGKQSGGFCGVIAVDSGKKCNQNRLFVFADILVAVRNHIGVGANRVYRLLLFLVSGCPGKQAGKQVCFVVRGGSPGRIPYTEGQRGRERRVTHQNIFGGAVGDKRVGDVCRAGNYGKAGGLFAAVCIFHRDGGQGCHPFGGAVDFLVFHRFRHLIFDRVEYAVIGKAYIVGFDHARRGNIQRAADAAGGISLLFHGHNDADTALGGGKTGGIYRRVPFAVLDGDGGNARALGRRGVTDADALVFRVQIKIAALIFRAVNRARVQNVLQNVHRAEFLFHKGKHKVIELGVVAKFNDDIDGALFGFPVGKSAGHAHLRKGEERGGVEINATPALGQGNKTVTAVHSVVKVGKTNVTECRPQPCGILRGIHIKFTAVVLCAAVRGRQVKQSVFHSYLI